MRAGRRDAHGRGHALQHRWHQRHHPTSTTSAAVIDVKMSSASVPLSVGGAVKADGRIYTQNDQFNGRIDNVTLQMS